MQANDPHSSEDHMPFNVGPLELIIVLVIALLVIGPKRLPEMGDAVGKTIREFRRASSDLSESTSLQPEPKPTTAPGPAAPPPAAPPPAAPPSDTPSSEPASADAGPTRDDD
jgi:sec-independent protein translocase protein TatA